MSDGMGGTQPILDAVTLEVLWTRLISMVNEAAAALVRTSFSTVLSLSGKKPVTLAIPSRRM